MAAKETPKKQNTSTYGKWVYQKTISGILTCSCGNKYLKTRKNQEVCVRCLKKSV